MAAIEDLEARLQALYDVYNSSYEEYGKSEAEREERLEHLQDDIDLAGAECSKLNGTIGCLRREIEELERKKSIEKQRMTDLQATNAALATKYDAQTIVYNRTCQQVADFQDEQAKLEVRKGELEKLQQDLQNKAANLDRRESKIDCAVEKIKAEEESIRKRNADLQAREKKAQLLSEDARAHLQHAEELKSGAERYRQAAEELVTKADEREQSASRQLKEINDAGGSNQAGFDKLHKEWLRCLQLRGSLTRAMGYAENVTVNSDGSWAALPEAYKDLEAVEDLVRTRFQSERDHAEMLQLEIFKLSRR